jgi:hypothetical protein
VRRHRQEQIQKTRAAVQERLTVEINHWDRQAVLLREQEKAGRPNAALNRARAEARADELADRRERRMRALALAEQISAAPPVVIGGAVVIPIGACWASGPARADRHQGDRGYRHGGGDSRRDRTGQPPPRRKRP